MLITDLKSKLTTVESNEGNVFSFYSSEVIPAGCTILLLFKDPNLNDFKVLYNLTTEYLSNTHQKFFFDISILIFKLSVHRF